MSPEEVDIEEEVESESAEEVVHKCGWGRGRSCSKQGVFRVKKYEKTRHYWLCAEHHAEHWKSRWDPKNGWEGLRNFLFDAFPEQFEESGGCPPHMVLTLKTIFEGLTNGRAIFANLAALFMFRGIGKSTLVIGAVAYAALFKMVEHVAYRGRSMNKAKVDFMDRLKGMLNEPILVQVFGEFIPKPKEIGTRWTETDIVLKNGVKIRCFGIDQSSHGSIGRTRRPQWWIWDDVEDFENVKTEESRLAMRVKIFGEDVPAADPVKSFGIYLGTPKHIDGLYSKIREHPAFKKVEFWLYKKNPDGSFRYDENGKRIPQWPERFPLERCIEIEAIYLHDPQLFNSEYLGILDFDEDKAIPEAILRTCEVKLERRFNRNWCMVTSVDGTPVAFPEWQACRVGISADLATSFKATSHDTGLSVLITLDTGWRIVYDLIFGKFYDRDVIGDGLDTKYYEIEMVRGKVVHRGIVGEIFRVAWEVKTDYVVIDAVGHQDQTRKQIEDIKTYWYDKNIEFEGHRFDIYKSTRNRYSDEKRDMIRKTVRGYAEPGMFFLRGPVKFEQSSTGVNLRKLPFPELVRQLVNLSSVTKDDLADSVAQNIDYSKSPAKESLHSYAFKLKTGTHKKEPYHDELFVLGNSTKF